MYRCFTHPFVLHAKYYVYYAEPHLRLECINYSELLLLSGMTLATDHMDIDKLVATAKGNKSDHLIQLAGLHTIQTLIR